MKTPETLTPNQERPTALPPATGSGVFRECRAACPHYGNYILDACGDEWITIQKEGCPMKRVNAFAFYTFGQTIQPLLQITAGQPVSEWSARLLQAAQWIESTCDNPMLPLRVCQNAGKNAVEWIRLITAKPGDYIITSADANALVVSLFDFQAVFREELSVADFYVVSQKAHFSTTTLVENGEQMFPADFRKELPEEAIHDIQQGARCFAFELPTAAGFHFLRAIEAVIHSFYDVLSGNAPRPHRSAMGIYIDELIKLNANPELVLVLRQIKDLHRNPVVHPEETLDMTEAQMLMGIMQSAMFSMIQITKEKKSTAIVAASPATSQP
jgi:hypothetical protein